MQVQVQVQVQVLVWVRVQVLVWVQVQAQVQVQVQVQVEYLEELQWFLQLLQLPGFDHHVPLPQVLLQQHHHLPLGLGQEQQREIPLVGA